MSSGLLMNDEFVAYFPALGRALGSVEDAVLVQALWFRRERATSTTTATIAELAESVGMTERTARRRLSKLASAGVLSKGRAGAYDATSVWAVNMSALDASPEPANMATSGCQFGGVDAATLAGSQEANLAGSKEANLAGSTYSSELEEGKKRTSVVAKSDKGPDSSQGGRPELETLCARLADRIEANGSPAPTITKRWLDAVRLMLDRDGRTVDEIAAAIDWSQSDEFWRANILSMPKLRQKFDTMRLQASRPAAGRRDRQADILAEEMNRARAADAAAGYGRLEVAR